MELSAFKDLSESIEKYGVNKAEMDTYKKICDAENKKIKELMAETELKTFDSESYTAKITEVDKSYVDEAKLLGVIHSNNIPDSLGIIKTKEYIDEDALESAIYNGLISDDVMGQISDCKVPKKEIRLNISKKKE
jgi:hypothetical protein